MIRPGSALGRFVAALLLVALPAMTAAMPLAGPASGGAAAGHAGHHRGNPAQHPPSHQQCCDLCGAACGGCTGITMFGHATPGPVLHQPIRISAGRERTRPVPRPRLLPFSLGPPRLLG